MAIQEGDIEAVSKITTNEKLGYDIQAREVLKDVLHVMEENPDMVAASVDASVKIYAATVRTMPELIPLVTPIRAVAVYLESFVREPLVEASGKYPDPASEVLGSISKGVFHLSNALAEVDGAMSIGVPRQVMISLAHEAHNLPQEARAEFIGKRRGFRNFLTERRMGLFMKDPTGGDLLWREYSDLIDLSEGRSPYEGYSLRGDPIINPTSVEGASFVLSAYGMIYKQAKEMVGEGLVVGQ